MSTKRWVNPDEIVAYHYRRPSSDAVGFADWLVVLHPLPDGYWHVVTRWGKANRPAPQQEKVVASVRDLHPEASVFARSAAEPKRLDRRYSAILTTSGRYSARIIVPNNVWTELHALLVKHQLLIPASNGDYDPPGLLGHVALGVSEVLSPAAGQYLFARAWDDHHTAIEVSLSTGKTDHIAVAACLAWKANGDRPVFRESEDLPKDWLKDRDLAAQVVRFARDVGLARMPDIIDYSRIATTTTWESLV